MVVDVLSLLDRVASPAGKLKLKREANLALLTNLFEAAKRVASDSLGLFNWMQGVLTSKDFLDLLPEQRTREIRNLQPTLKGKRDALVLERRHLESLCDAADRSLDFENKDANADLTRLTSQARLLVRIPEEARDKESSHAARVMHFLDGYMQAFRPAPMDDQALARTAGKIAGLAQLMETTWAEVTSKYERLRFFCTVDDGSRSTKKSHLARQFAFRLLYAGLFTGGLLLTAIALRDAFR